MTTLELFVSLKVPDNVAISSYQALSRMGFSGVKKIERKTYFKFELTGNVKDFKKKITQVDLIVNANKHKYDFSLNESDYNFKKLNVLVQNLENGSGLLTILKERLGFKNIKKIEKGILWTLYFEKQSNAEEITNEITKNLLMNDNYQKFRVMN